MHINCYHKACFGAGEWVLAVTVFLSTTNIFNASNNNLSQLWISGEDSDEGDLQELWASCQYFGTEENENIYHRVGKPKGNISIIKSAKMLVVEAAYPMNS